MPTLPTDSSERKRYPLFSGLLRYFPAALAGVAHHSVGGNEKHVHPGRPYNPDVDTLLHDRTKSTDHADCILRHLMDLSDLQARHYELCQSRSVDAQEHAVPATEQAILAEANALAWRALALAQEMHEHFGMVGAAPAAYWPDAEPGPKPEPGPAVTVDPHIVPGPDGWIEHDGTASSEPANGDMLVQVRLRSGSGTERCAGPAFMFCWNHIGTDGDIVAWRPAP